MAQGHGSEHELLSICCERKKVQHSIKRLLWSDGSYVENDEKIAKEVISVYEKLCETTCENLSPIDLEDLGRGLLSTEAQGDRLIQPVTAEEIKEAVFSISEQKAPGPDGYGVGFFKDTWDIISDDVILAVSDFFSTLAKL